MVGGGRLVGAGDDQGFSNVRGPWYPSVMVWLASFIQIVVALGLCNVWLLRFNHPTPYRGGGAQNMREEFAVYGLSRAFCYFVGALKLTVAALLIAAFFQPRVGMYASGVLLVLMLGAVLMHYKVGDPVRKAVPAAVMLFFSVVLLARYTAVP
jgi:hypothetical protein